MKSISKNINHGVPAEDPSKYFGVITAIEKLESSLKRLETPTIEHVLKVPEGRYDPIVDAIDAEGLARRQEHVVLLAWLSKVSAALEKDNSEPFKDIAIGIQKLVGAAEEDTSHEHLRLMQCLEGIERAVDSIKEPKVVVNFNRRYVTAAFVAAFLVILLMSATVAIALLR